VTATEPIRDRIPPPWGRPLNENDYVALAASWITPEIADAAMLRRVDEQEGREAVGQKGSRDCAGLLFPYYLPHEPAPVNYRVRRDRPDVVQGKNGELKTSGKYLGAPGAGNRLYIPPGITLEQLADVKAPLAIVEGEKKALALWRLASHESDQPRFIPVAIPGVWSWRGKVGKTGGPKGERLDVKGPIPDLGRIHWDGRTVFITFDSNVHTNDEVKFARSGIARHLTQRGAGVKLVNLPEDCGVNGVDDLLAAWGPAKVLELFARAVSGARLEVVPPPQFESRPNGMFRVVRKGELLSQSQLSNYEAAIKTSITLDDGVETSREFEIEATLMGRPLRFTIPAPEFARMDWPIERMGATAITYPNQKDYARTAIQSFSFAAPERVIYTHTGWRKVDGKWLFLDAGGAIGDKGLVSDVAVRLSGSINSYQLRLPAGADALRTAVRAGLRLLELGPPPISFPLLAATYRAVLGGADFALHLAGETGAFKSELAALHQQHFGSGMDRRHLPAAWSSTGNALEVTAFSTKDMLLVIDDFAPQGSAADIARYHAVADRVFRAAGNQAGRGRLDSAAKLRDAKPPRSLILSTGEETPRGHSIRARLFILEIAKGAINPGNLSACQKDAQAGLYAEAMGGFVQWIAGRCDEVRAAFEARVFELRGMALSSLAHARTSDIVASLQAGFELFLDFCIAYDAVGDVEQEHLANRCWEALRNVALVQTKHHAATEPTARFLELTRASLAAGRAHLQSREGTTPDKSPGACGWRCVGNGNWSPQGDCIGWVEGDDLYLQPTAAYRLVQVAGRDAGEVLAISEQTLKKRLHEKGLLASTDAARQTLTVRKRIGGTSKDVLHFYRKTLLPEDPDTSDVADGDEAEFVGFCVGFLAVPDT
jgi:hypothetical protein